MHAGGRAGRQRLARRAAGSCAAASLAALAGSAAAADGVRVGPGLVVQTLVHADYRVQVRISPNAGGRRANTFVVKTIRSGRPVRARVSLRFTMPGMGMPSLGLRLRESTPGAAAGVGETLTMPGRWQIALHVAPAGAAPFDLLLIDTVRL
jgi:hypothetical protein